MYISIFPVQKSNLISKWVIWNKFFDHKQYFSINSSLHTHFVWHFDEKYIRTRIVQLKETNARGRWWWWRQRRHMAWFHKLSKYFENGVYITVYQKHSRTRVWVRPWVYERIRARLPLFASQKLHFANVSVVISFHTTLSPYIHSTFASMAVNKCVGVYKIYS